MNAQDTEASALLALSPLDGRYDGKVGGAAHAFQRVRR